MKRLMMVALAFLVMLPAWVMATGEAETAAPEGPLAITALAPFSGTNKPEVYPYWAELANEKFNLEIDFERTSRDGIDEKINLRFAAGDYFDWLDATNANPPRARSSAGAWRGTWWPSTISSTICPTTWPSGPTSLRSS